MASPGIRLPPVTLYADKKEVESAFEMVNKTWMCHKCGEAYCLLDSMGTLSCWQHPGFVQENGKWSCCGKAILPARWSDNWPITRMYHDAGQCFPYKPLPQQRGCQPCDHNTSDATFTPKDATAIGDLAALIPFFGRTNRLQGRAGFKDGKLWRCSPDRCIRCPPNATTVTYMNLDGNIAEYSPGDGGPLPQGLEISAEDDNGRAITTWVP